MLVSCFNDEWVSKDYKLYHHKDEETLNPRRIIPIDYKKKDSENTMRIKQNTGKWKSKEQKSLFFKKF